MPDPRGVSVELLVLAGVLVVPVLLFLGARRWDASRPLELADVLVVQEVGPGPALRVRARLGSGRRVDRCEVEATWQGTSGPHPLRRDDPVGRTVGPWTITLRCDGALPTDGQLTLRVTAWEGGRSWMAERSFDVAQAVPGSFAPLVEVQAGRVSFVRAWSTASRVIEGA